CGPVGDDVRVDDVLLTVAVAVGAWLAGGTVGPLDGHGGVLRVERAVAAGTICPAAPCPATPGVPVPEPAPLRRAVKGPVTGGWAGARRIARRTLRCVGGAVRAITGGLPAGVVLLVLVL